MEHYNIFIRCENCGGILPIGERIGDSKFFKTIFDGQSFVYALQKFFEDHIYCNVKNEEFTSPRISPRYTFFILYSNDAFAYKTEEI